MSDPGNAAWPRAVLFDLDGTLILSAPDLHASINILLARHGYPALTLPQVEAMIGNGVRKLVERAFAASGAALTDEALDAAYHAMVEIYDLNLTVLTTLVPGAADAIANLRKGSARIGVVTNKPQRPTESILDHFGLSKDIDIVIGGDAGPARKPAPDMLLAALTHLGVDAADALMVGDSPADVDSARAAGVTVFALRGGYTGVPVDDLGADLVIDSLDDLATAIARHRASA